MGIRGIPANYGGFETFAEALGPRLVDRGHEVTVYCRTNYYAKHRPKVYKGVRLIFLPTLENKYLDTPIHTLLSVLHSIKPSYDLVLMCNAANAIFAVVPRALGTKVVVNVDGIERLRKKWGFVGKSWYKVGEYLATKLPNSIVSDAEVIRQYYASRYGVDSVMIPYGADTSLVTTTRELERLGIEPRKYVLVVTRLEPENNADLVVRAFADVETPMNLVIVGDAPYATAYKKALYSLAQLDSRVILTGYIFGQGYKELQANAYCYVQATEVGGTHPALIEAMGSGNLVIANGTTENMEVVGETGMIYHKNDLSDLRTCLQIALDVTPGVMAEYGKLAKKRVSERYSWQAVTDRYESLFEEVLEVRRG